MTLRIGTAGWSIPKQHAPAFPGTGSHLERYASAFQAVEINSSFYRPHRPATYARWAGSVPEGFRFAVKVPRVITHERQLVDTAEPLSQFLREVGALGPALGPLLVQLPPSLRYDEAVAIRFLSSLLTEFSGDIVCEPRHATWFTEDTEACLSSFRVARAAVDPAVVPRAAEPGGWKSLAYIRLHGSPEIYRSAYPSDVLDETADRLRSALAEGATCWCIFDNTALGAATGNALDLLTRV